MKALDDKETPLTPAELLRRSALSRSRGKLVYPRPPLIGPSVQGCVGKCWLGAYAFAGMQKGSQCWCGHSLVGLHKVEDKYCYSRCQFNCRQYCGGAMALSVYRTGYVPPPVLTGFNIERGIIACREPQYTSDNCRSYIDWKVSPDLFSPIMTPMMCAVYCRTTRSRRAAFKDKYTCCCDLRDRYHPHWRQNARDRRYCNQPCAAKLGKVPCVGEYNHRFVSIVIDVMNDRIFPMGWPPQPLPLYSGGVFPLFTQRYEHEYITPVTTQTTAKPTTRSRGDSATSRPDLRQASATLLSRVINKSEGANNASLPEYVFTMVHDIHLSTISPTWLAAGGVAAFILLFCVVGNLMRMRNLSNLESFEATLAKAEKKENKKKKKKKKKKMMKNKSLKKNKKKKMVKNKSAKTKTNEQMTTKKTTKPEKKNPGTKTKGQKTTPAQHPAKNGKGTGKTQKGREKNVSSNCSVVFLDDDDDDDPDVWSGSENCESALLGNYDREEKMRVNMDWLQIV